MPASSASPAHKSAEEWARILVCPQSEQYKPCLQLISCNPGHGTVTVISLELALSRALASTERVT